MKAVAAARRREGGDRERNAADAAAWQDCLPGGGWQQRILISTRADAAADLVYHPQTLVLGIGCERLARRRRWSVLARRCLADAKSGAAIRRRHRLHRPEGGGTGDSRPRRPRGVPARFFSREELEAERPRPQEHPSEVVFQETGCHGVAGGPRRSRRCR